MTAPTPEELHQIAEKKPKAWHKDVRELVKLAAEKQCESLQLYEPTPFQEVYHRQKVKEVILSKGNQCGGSLAGGVEVARCVTNQDPYGKYPGGGVVACLGYGEGHIGRVIHKYLFRWGAFEIIRDLKTGLWRTFRPWPASETRLGKEGDLERKPDARPAPPLIPRRFIDGRFSWKKRSEYIFSYVKLNTGWEIYAFNSAGEYEHSQGFQCDLFWIDEDVARDGWVAEATARLSKRDGKLRWTAMPHMETEDLTLIVQRAEEEAGKETPRTVVIYAGIDDNPYLSDKVKEDNRAIWRSMGDMEYVRRTTGRLLTGSIRMYPSFDKSVHAAVVEKEYLDDPDLPLVKRLLTERKGEIPDDWCRYLSIDPGYTVAAGVFIAVPPPDVFGVYRIAYDELYITNATASEFVRLLAQKVKPVPFREFLFDFHGGRLRSIATGDQPLDVYMREFRKAGIRSDYRGGYFTPGCDEIKVREMALREWLTIRSAGNKQEINQPTFLVIPEKCPNLIREIEGFKRKTAIVNGKKVTLDEGNRKHATHAVEGLEMAAAHGLPFFRPKNREVKVDSVDIVLNMHKEWARRRATYGTPVSLSDGINLCARGARP